MPSPAYQLLRKDGVQDLHNMELIKACKEDRELLGEFLTSNRDFIFSILRHFKGNIDEVCLKFRIEEEELYQHACIGIMTALETYDFNAGIKFSTYVYRPILWEVNQLIYGDSRHVKLSRGAVDMLKRMIEIEDTLGYRPSEDEMCDLLGITIERYREIAMFSDGVDLYDAIDTFDKADHETRHFEHDVNNKVYVESLLDSGMFTEFELNVMKLILEDSENTYTKIADKLGVYPMTINRVLARVKGKIEASESTIVKEKNPSKYVKEIKLIAQEKEERGEIMDIAAITDLLDVCGYKATDYSTRVLYYIRQKAMLAVGM